jgi:ABC-type enterochelin transport system ATPase subunit
MRQEEIENLKTNVVTNILRWMMKMMILQPYSASLFIIHHRIQIASSYPDRIIVGRIDI